MYDSIEQQIKQQQEGQQPAVTPVVEPVVADPQPQAEPQVQAVAEPTVPVASPQAIEPVIDTHEPTEEIPWYEKNQADAKPNATDPAPAAAAAAEAEEDEDVKLLREFKKSGKSLKEFVNEFNIPDYANLDDSDIVALGLEQLEGFKGDDYATAVEEFNAMSLFQRRKIVQEYRNTFLQQSESKLKQLSQVYVKQEDKFKQTVERFESEVDTLAREISGKELYGLKVTDEMSAKIVNFLKKEISLNRPDGSIDADLMADFALWRLYGKDIVRTNVTAAKNAGRKEMLVATTNPSSGGGPSNASGNFQTTGADDAFNAYVSAKKR
jgi:hypothetical protein